MKKVVKTTYACEICFNEFDTEQDALRCEKRGVAISEFKKFEAVEFTGLKDVVEATTVSGFRVGIRNGTRAVVQTEDWPNSHYLPLGYDVWVLTPGQKIGDRPVFKEMMSGIDRKFLKKVHVSRDGRCHLCAGTILTLVYYTYLGIGHELPYLTVDVQKCSKCNVKFFTSAQSKNVDKLVRQKCCWQIASTKKLIKENAFQY